MYLGARKNKMKKSNEFSQDFIVIKLRDQYYTIDDNSKENIYSLIKVSEEEREGSCYSCECIHTFMQFKYIPSLYFIPSAYSEWYTWKKYATSIIAGACFAKILASKMCFRIASSKEKLSLYYVHLSNTRHVAHEATHDMCHMRQHTTCGTWGNTRHVAHEATHDM